MQYRGMHAVNGEHCKRPAFFALHQEKAGFWILHTAGIESVATGESAHIGGDPCAFGRLAGLPCLKRRIRGLLAQEREVVRIDGWHNRIVPPGQNFRGVGPRMRMRRADEDGLSRETGLPADDLAAIACPFRRDEEDIKRNQHRWGALVFQTEDRGEKRIVHARRGAFRMRISNEKTGLRWRDVPPPKPRP